MTVYKLTCVICPLSCSVEVEVEGNRVKDVRGFSCPRGKEWAVEEVLSPKRVVMTVIRVRAGKEPVVSVKTDSPIPKERIRELMSYLATLEVEAPVFIGQVVVEHPLGLETKVVATRSVEAVETREHA
ncbi:MAG: DUF1667 domain-containing protein [Candidatus Korarchaeota archaeon]|nr:DUF1667 domain-containing protein [Candidatus Korarchaeota archaeon]